MNPCGAIVKIPTYIAKRLPLPWISTIVLLAMVVSGSAHSAAAQTSCFQTPQYSATSTSNSPPISVFVLEGTIPPNYMTITSVTTNSPWANSVSILQPGTGMGGSMIAIDPRGQSPACYGILTNIYFTGFFAPTFDGGTGQYYCGTIPDPGGQECTISSVNSWATNVNVTATTAVELIDPVPDLVSGNAVKSSTQLQNQLTSGRIVKGVAADGVTQLLIRIDTTSPGHQFAITLADDQGLSGSNILPNEDGSLDFPGGSSFSSGQLTVNAGSADSNGMGHAFAVYRAPPDFARPSVSGFKSGTCQGVSKTDDQLACRAVSLQIQDTTANTILPTVPITIVRPPVFLIHGLWGDWSGWNTFSPLVTGKKSVDPRFHVERVSYDWDVGSLIKSSNPTYTASMSTAKANSLGVQYVTPFVLTQVAKAIGKFKNGDNPVKLPVAAVQADVVAHSMGGVVTRTLPLVAGFFSNTFGQGTVHKVISVDVPHLGSPLAALLLDPTADCTREILAANGLFSFKSVNFNNAPNMPVSGGVGDMVNSPMASVLTAISNPGPHPLRIALIAGAYTNFSSLDCTTNLVGYPCAAYYIRTKCGPKGDLMGSKFNGTSWPLIFGTGGSNANDAVVPQNSQLNGLAITNGINGFIYSGLVHSPTLTKLSFTGPSVLDSASAPNPVANQVITLLNTPYTQPAFQTLNP